MDSSLVSSSILSLKCLLEPIMFACSKNLSGKILIQVGHLILLLNSTLSAWDDTGIKFNISTHLLILTTIFSSRRTPYHSEPIVK